MIIHLPLFFSANGTNSSAGGSGTSGDDGGSSSGSGTVTIDYSSVGVFAWIAQGFNNVITGITQGLSYINPTSQNFFGIKIIELFQNLFNFLFVPSVNSFSQVTNVFNEKLAFIDSINLAIESLENILNNNITAIPSLVFDVETSIYTGEIAIDFGWFAQFKPWTDLLFTGFIYLFFLWRLFKKLPNIINGFSNDYDDIK